jgi:hypothetical protein
MRKSYSLLQRNTEVFIQKLNKIMEMETNEQAMDMNWDVLIQEADIMVGLLTASKVEIEAELVKLANEAKAESRKEYNESQRGKERATFSFLGNSDSQIAKELQKQEDEELLVRAKKVRYKFPSMNIHNNFMSWANTNLHIHENAFTTTNNTLPTAR